MRQRRRGEQGWRGGEQGRGAATRRFVDPLGGTKMLWVEARAVLKLQTIGSIVTPHPKWAEKAGRPAAVSHSCDC